jgi:hypothetical protein
VRNEVLRRVKEERNILQTIKRRKANWIGNILRRNANTSYQASRIDIMYRIWRLYKVIKNPS